MTNWYHTYQGTCRKCGKTFQHGCPWRKFCPGTDCFEIWRREKYMRTKAQWSYEHPDSPNGYSAALHTPKLRASEKTPDAKKRSRDLFYAHKVARELGLSAYDVMVSWGLPPGKASRRKYRKPEERPWMSMLPKHWSDAG